jgi:hypothetical protein
VTSDDERSPLLVVVTGRRGRPPRASVRATKRIEFVVTAAELKALEHVAAENRQHLAAVIRDAVNTFVADYGERVVFLPSGDRFPKKPTPP